MTADNFTTSTILRRAPLAARFALLALLAAIELPFIAFLYDPAAIGAGDANWETARIALREFVPYSVFFLAGLGVVATPKRAELFSDWRSAARTYGWGKYLCANLIGYAGMLAATLALNSLTERQTPPWGLFALWTGGVAGVYGLLALAFAPARWWRAAISRHLPLIAIAAIAAAVIETAALMSRQSWGALASATFHFSAWLLGLFESDVLSDPARRILGVGDFRVNIATACSGYEGIGLVLTFLSIYLYIFRSNLRFPNVWLILPIGVAAIWTLNAVRIALLVSIGAHISPEIAVGGFHSQTGWMMFLGVTIGVMLATHRISYFHTMPARGTVAEPAANLSEAIALLAPFLAMTAATIIAAAFSPEDGGHWLYLLRVGAILAALYFSRRYYLNLDWRLGAAPWLLGLVVGALWIATDPGRGAGETALAVWIESLPPAALGLWLCFRLAGTILLVPMAEELAFRGYLHRKLVADRFAAVDAAAFSWKAFIISSILFGALHERWLAGALAGAVFAVALYQSKKITGAIAAHMSANAIIALWAIVFGQWSLF